MLSPLPVFIHQEISHIASNFPGLCEVRLKSQPDCVYRSSCPIGKPYPQHISKIFRTFDMFVHRAVRNECSLGFIEFLDLTIFSGRVEQIEIKTVERWSVLHRSPESPLNLQRNLHRGCDRIMPYDRPRLT